MNITEEELNDIKDGLTGIDKGITQKPYIEERIANHFFKLKKANKPQIFKLKVSPSAKIDFNKNQTHHQIN